MADRSRRENSRADSGRAAGSLRSARITSAAITAGTPGAASLNGRGSVDMWCTKNSFGASAPAGKLYEHFGITAAGVAAAARRTLGR